MQIYTTREYIKLYYYLFSITLSHLLHTVPTSLRVVPTSLRLVLLLLYLLGVITITISIIITNIWWFCICIWLFTNDYECKETLRLITILKSDLKFDFDNGNSFNSF